MKARVATLLLLLGTGVAAACGTEGFRLPSQSSNGGPSEGGFRTLVNGCGVSSGVTLSEDGVILGTDGTDLIDCSAAVEPVEVRTGPGRDAIKGSRFDDLLYAGEGVDGIRAGEGDDIVDGGPGDDRSATTETPALEGGPGDDTVIGGDGDDSLHGGPGNDLCNGGAGKDLYNACENTRDPDG